MPRRDRRGATRRSTARPARLRLPELRHSLPRERRHRSGRLAGCGADSRARSARRHRRDARAGAVARRKGAARSRRARSADHDLCRGPGNLTMAMGITLAENRVDLAGRSPVRRGSRASPAPIAWGPRIGIRVGVERPWRAYRRGTSRGVRGRVSSSESVATVQRCLASHSVSSRRLLPAQLDAVVDALDRLVQRSRGGGRAGARRRTP